LNLLSIIALACALVVVAYAAHSFETRAVDVHICKTTRGDVAFVGTRAEKQQLDVFMSGHAWSCEALRMPRAELFHLRAALRDGRLRFTPSSTEK
jgi:hypothetical protein